MNSLVNYPPPLHSIFYNNTKSEKGSSLVNLLHFADYKSQCAIRVSGSSTGTASPIQIDGRENCVTEI